MSSVAVAFNGLNFSCCMLALQGHRKQGAELSIPQFLLTTLFKNLRSIFSYGSNRNSGHCQCMHH